MSTVLKAAQEIERRGRPIVASSVAAAGSDETGSRLWFFVVAGLTVTAGGALLALQMTNDRIARGAPPAVSVAVEAAPPPVTVPPVAVREPAPRAAQVAVAEAVDVPWGRVDDDSTVPEPEAAPARVAVASLPPASAKRMQGHSAPVVAKAARRPSPPGDAADEMEETEPVTRASGGARVQIRQIFYAADSAERAVSLRIGGGPSVILHQGEAARGVEVQLITRAGVYVRQGGEIFMVSARR